MNLWSAAKVLIYTVGKDVRGQRSAGRENQWTGNPTGVSNPSPSATQSALQRKSALSLRKPRKMPGILDNVLETGPERMDCPARLIVSSCLFSDAQIVVRFHQPTSRRREDLKRISGESGPRTVSILTDGRSVALCSNDMYQYLRQPF
jgi:hypothetical protein